MFSIAANHHPALGDYLFKLPAVITTSVFLRAQPEFIYSKKLVTWLSRNITPPYLSNRPDVFHHPLTGRIEATPNTFLIMCSDGLTAVYPKATNNITHWVQTVGSAMERGESPVLALLWQALGADADTVAQYMTLESTDVWIDDVTIAVLTL